MTDPLPTLAGGGTAGLIVGLCIAVAALAGVVVHLYRKRSAADRTALAAAEAREATRLEEAQAREEARVAEAKECAREQLATQKTCIEVTAKALEATAQSTAALREIEPILDALTERSSVTSKRARQDTPRTEDTWPRRSRPSKP